MANKYVIHGATFNGDGTTSSAAGSEGAAGAWNDISEVMTSTTPGGFGTVAKGDVIYAATNDGTSDLSHTISSNISTTTFDDPDDTVTLIFDDGTNVGSAGTFTFNRTGSANITNNGWIIRGGGRLVINNTRNTTETLMLNSGEIHDLQIDINGAWPSIRSGNYVKSIFRNLTINLIGSYSTSAELFVTANGASAYYENILIDCDTNPMSGTGNLFATDNGQTYGHAAGGTRTPGCPMTDWT